MDQNAEQCMRQATQPPTKSNAAPATSSSAAPPMSSNAPHLMNSNAQLLQRQATSSNAQPPTNSSAPQSMRPHTRRSAPPPTRRCAPAVEDMARGVQVTEASKSAPRFLNKAAPAYQSRSLCRSVLKCQEKTASKSQFRHQGNHADLCQSRTASRCLRKTAAVCLSRAAQVCLCRHQQRWPRRCVAVVAAVDIMANCVAKTLKH